MSAYLNSYFSSRDLGNLLPDLYSATWKSPPGLIMSTALRIAVHMSPVWCNTPQEYTISCDSFSAIGHGKPSVSLAGLSNILALNIFQPALFSKCSLVYCDACIEYSSISMLVILLQPSLAKLNEDNPLPQPM